MEFNSNIPVLVPAIIGLIALSVTAGLALALVRRPEARKWIARAWLVLAVLIVTGVALFWIATALVEGPRRATIDHSLQDRQQNELQHRLQSGGH